jgi:hypothetical protein
MAARKLRRSTGKSSSSNPEVAWNQKLVGIRVSRPNACGEETTLA